MSKFRPLWIISLLSRQLNLFVLPFLTLGSFGSSHSDVGVKFQAENIQSLSATKQRKPNGKSNGVACRGGHMWIS